MHTNEYKVLRDRLLQFAHEDLRSELKKRGYSISDLCFALDISRTAYYDKVKRGTWVLDELLIILNFLTTKKLPRKFRKNINKKV